MKKSYPINKEYGKIFAAPIEDRRALLEKTIWSLDTSTMAYASISDALYNTHLCNDFPDKMQCNDQYTVIKVGLSWEKIDPSNITLETPKTAGVYAHENNFSNKEYLDFIDSLLQKLLQNK